MNDHDDVDPIQAAQITRRIGQTFDFVRDAIDNPRTLEKIPTGSVLFFREAIIDQTAFHLTAFAAKADAGQRTARVTGPSDVLSTGEHAEETGESAEVALDKFEARLREDTRLTWSGRRAVGE
jgi:hypothetical protein